MMTNFRSAAQALAAAALLALIAGSAGASADSHPRVSVSSAVGRQGERVAVSITGESGAETFGAFNFRLAFDGSVLSALECTSSVGICRTEASGQAVLVAGVSLAGLSGHVEFAMVTFDVIGGPGSSSPLDLQALEVADPEAVDIAAITEVLDGAVDVVGDRVLRGDATCDGDVDAVDALAVLNAVAGEGGPACPQAADVDCDGGLTAVDALWVLRHVAGLPLEFPSGCTPIGQ